MNAKIKCLDVEQVETLARLHGRVLKPEASIFAVSPGFSQAQSQMALSGLSDADLRARLTQMEVHIATLQTQLNELTLQPLREQKQRAEQCLLALQAQLISTGEHTLAFSVDCALGVPDQSEALPFACHPTEKRTLLIPQRLNGEGSQWVQQWVAKEPV